MQKGTIIGIIVFLVLSLGLYFLTTNAHMDFFPGTNIERDWKTGQIVSKTDGMVSLRMVSRDRAELNIGGYIVAFLFIIGIPALIGFMIGKKMNKPSVKTA